MLRKIKTGTEWRPRRGRSRGAEIDADICVHHLVMHCSVCPTKIVNLLSLGPVTGYILALYDLNNILAIDAKVPVYRDHMNPSNTEYWMYLIRLLLNL